MKILITGAAGFIGSHLVSACLHRGDQVVAYDNLLTGKRENLAAVLDEDPGFEARLTFLQQDVRDLEALSAAASGCNLIFHEAAIGSVPWSLDDPMLAHATNLGGFVNVLQAARANAISRVVYASSSAVFGDSPESVAHEGHEGRVLSPYAATKRAQEVYAEAWASCYDMTIVGLRYFNVFGARQDPNGAYAAVIPKWADCMKHGRACTIYGCGAETRDYCHVSNVVHANLLAAAHDFGAPAARAFNIGCGVETSLDQLFAAMRDRIQQKYGVRVPDAVYQPMRKGDIARSCACIDAAKTELGYAPMTSVADGLRMYL